MAPRPAPPPEGGRVRLVSLLIDIGGGSVEDHDHVRLLVRRLLSHFSRQRPAPRWCVRFYDSCLSPHAFDAKLRARADERDARRAEEEARERERNATDSRVHSWVDEHTRETAGVGSLRVASGKDAGARLGGASEAARATQYRDFGACDDDAEEAFLRHHDDAVSLYHDVPRRAQTERGAETADASRETAARAAHATDVKNRLADESSWFTTLARQMAATLEESGPGHADERGVETTPDEAFGVMLVLARVGVSAGTTASETVAASRGPGATAPLALAAAAEEKRRENVARAFKGIEAALRKAQTVAHLLRLPFDAEASFENDASPAKRASSSLAARDAPGPSDDSSASAPSSDIRDATERARVEIERRALRVAARSAWRRVTALFSGFGGCALPAALVAHAAAHLAPCALMAAAADAVSKALDESERCGASLVSGDSEVSALPLALAHGDDAPGLLAGDIEAGDAAAAARVRVREGALETRGDPREGTRATTTRRFAETRLSPNSVVSRRTGATVSLGVATLVRGDGDHLQDRFAAREGADADDAEASSTTVTIEALVALDDETESTTFGGASHALVPRANDDALGGLAALLALRGVAAVAEVTEWRVAARDARDAARRGDAAAADEEEFDVMATQEEVARAPETRVIANRRVAVVRPLFARALSLQFVDGPRSRPRARGTGNLALSRVRALAASGADEATRALAAASLLGDDTYAWGCVESVAEELNPTPAAPLGDRAAERRDEVSARPFAFASSPEYKPAPSAPGFPALPFPPGIDAGAPNAGEETGERAAAGDGGGETRVARGARDASDNAACSLAEAFAEAANAAPVGTHRWEAWYGDGPGIGADVAQRLASRASPGFRDDPESTAPLRLPAPADGFDRSAHPKTNADAALAARFDAMVEGLPAPANALAPVPASPSDSRDAEAGDADAAEAEARAEATGEPFAVRSGTSDGVLALALVPTTAERRDEDALPNRDPRNLPASIPDALLSASALPGGAATDVDAVAARVAEAYASTMAACFAAPAEATDPPAGDVAEALAAKTADAFQRALRPGLPPRDECEREVAIKRRAHDLATRALFATAKDLRAAHSGVAGAAAKAAKRREHLLQAHLRFACARIAPVRPLPSATAKLAKAVARLVGAVTFLLTPVGAEGVRRFVEGELAPRYFGEESAGLLAAVRAELGVADPTGPQAPQGAGGGGAVFSPAARVRPVPNAPGARPRGHATGPLRGSGVDAAPRPAGGAARLGARDLAAAKAPEGWHPVFRSRATRAHRRVAMPAPAHAAAERAREAAREAERRASERAAASAALIERDGAFGRNRWADGRGGTRAARVDPRVSRASAGLPGAMPAPRRLAAEFGSGNDDARDPAPGPASTGRAPPSSAERRASSRRVSGGARAFSGPGGFETPARDARAAGSRAGGRAVGGRFGSTWLPLGGGLETPAVARTRVAATPVAATRAAAGGARRTPRVPGTATVVAATPARGPATRAAAAEPFPPLGAAGTRVAETPAAANASRGTATDGKDAADAPRAAPKRRAGRKARPGLASFGAMVREGRELAETELGGGKRARR